MHIKWNKCIHLMGPVSVIFKCDFFCPNFLLEAVQITEWNAPHSISQAALIHLAGFSGLCILFRLTGTSVVIPLPFNKWFSKPHEPIVSQSWVGLLNQLSSPVAATNSQHYTQQYLQIKPAWFPLCLSWWLPSLSIKKSINQSTTITASRPLPLIIFNWSINQPINQSINQPTSITATSNLSLRQTFDDNRISVNVWENGIIYQTTPKMSLWTPLPIILKLSLLR